MFRMPAGFGPAPGPRNLPAAERHRRYEKTTTTLSLSAETDALAALPLTGFGPATMVRSTGGGDGSGHRRLQ